MAFNVGDTVRLTDAEALIWPQFVGEMWVDSIHTNGYVLCLHPNTSGAIAFLETSLVFIRSAGAMVQPTSPIFKVMDRVRYTSNLLNSNLWSGQMLVVIIHSHPVLPCTYTCEHPINGRGIFKEEELQLVPTVTFTNPLMPLSRPGYGLLVPQDSEFLPTVATPPPLPVHSCDNNRKTYDSGWSRYDYCAICDQKIDEIKIDRI